MKIVIAPDSFKESLSATQVAQAIARGVKHAIPNARTVCLPMADGGEGTVEAVLGATHGQRRTKTVQNANGEPISASWAWLGHDTAVIEMAAAAGLPVTPHSANLSLVTMCTMHLLGAIPNAGKYLELSIEGADYYPWQQELFIGDPYRVEAGRVQIPSAPGWGVEINPAWLARAEYRRAA